MIIYMQFTCVQLQLVWWFGDTQSISPICVPNLCGESYFVSRLQKVIDLSSKEARIYLPYTYPQKGSTIQILLK